jgi:predicted outer membrane protein
MFAQQSSAPQQDEKRAATQAEKQQGKHGQQKQEQQKQSARRINAEEGKPVASMPPLSNAQLSLDDQLFLEALIQEDISEIDLAGMALEKSDDPDVKQYAQTKILAADPQMRDGAAQIASAHGMTPPTEPEARQKEIKDKLSKMSGKLFDNAYMGYEANQQDADVKLVNAELAATKNPAVKAYVTKEKTPVEQAAAAALQVHTKIAQGLTNYRQDAMNKGSE